MADLSDRIEPVINGSSINQQYPPRDINEIEKILEFFRNECVKPGEKIGDKSSISFSTFSSDPVASIDIDIIKDLGEKQEFINSTGKYQENGLSYEIEVFNQKVKAAYRNIRNDGLDLISVMMEKIEGKNLIKESKLLTNGIDSTFINFENHVYIFTDGYLEYKGKSINNQFYFGYNEIKSIRDYCKKQKVDIKTAINNNSSFCLTPIKCNKNKLIDLHVFETHERDFNSKKQGYNNTIGFRDNEILEEVWRKWAYESGFKSFEWGKYNEEISN
jgi:hypothetical protein